MLKETPTPLASATTAPPDPVQGSTRTGWRREAQEQVSRREQSREQAI